jgi:hypothetical protein
VVLGFPSCVSKRSCIFHNDFTMISGPLHSRQCALWWLVAQMILATPTVIKNTSSTNYVVRKSWWNTMSQETCRFVRRTAQMWRVYAFYFLQLSKITNKSKAIWNSFFLQWSCRFETSNQNRETADPNRGEGGRSEQPRGRGSNRTANFCRRRTWKTFCWHTWKTFCWRTWKTFCWRTWKTFCWRTWKAICCFRGIAKLWPCDVMDARIHAKFAKPHVSWRHKTENSQPLILPRISKVPKIQQICCSRHSSVRCRRCRVFRDFFVAPSPAHKCAKAKRKILSRHELVTVKRTVQ